MKLPDLVFEQLRHLLEMGDIQQWAIGDFIRDVWEEIEKNIPEGSERKEYASMIRQMANATGADESTLRSRTKMSRFYSDADRDVWQPPYTYHHLRALMSAGDDWPGIAMWGLTGGFNDGVATVQEIRDKIRGDRDPLELTRARIERLHKTVDRIMVAEETPENVVIGMSLLPAILEDVLDLLP